MPPRVRVLGLALRIAQGRPVREVPEAFAPADGWLEGDHGSWSGRGLTFVAEDDWRAACDDLGARVPWTLRRANVLVSGGSLLPLLGRSVRVGDLRVRIEGETKPCARMDEQHPGLRAALEAPGRGGVYGRILEGGRIRLEDSLQVEGDA